MANQSKPEVDNDTYKTTRPVIISDGVPQSLTVEEAETMLRDVMARSMNIEPYNEVHGFFIRYDFDGVREKDGVVKMTVDKDGNPTPELIDFKTGFDKFAKLLREQYNYVITKHVIECGKDGTDDELTRNAAELTRLNRALREWKNAHDKPGNLLIAFYRGHGTISAVDKGALRFA
jgi:hypothetical protein